MSKFQIAVCLPPGAAADVEAALTAAMAPFDLNLTVDGNPVGEWDWWRIDGGVDGFVVRPEHDGDSRLVHCDPAVFGFHGVDRPPLRCDGGPRGLLDLHSVEPADVVSLALLTLDGEWVEALQLGSFAEVRAGEDVHAAYLRQAFAYLDGLPDDCLIVRLHCHC